MKNKKIAALSAFLLTANLFAGCGGTAETPAENVSDTETVSQSEQSETETSAAETESAVSEEASETTAAEIPEMDTSPLTVTFMTSADIVSDDEVSAKITELTGITLEVTQPKSADYAKEIKLMADSDMLPDMIYLPKSMDSLIGSGSVVPLNDYINTYGENIRGMYGDSVNYLKSGDGNIYTVGTNAGGNSFTEPYGTFQIQHRVLKELGYPEIRSAEQFEKALKDYLELHPTNDDGTTNTGLLLCGRASTQWEYTIGGMSAMALGFGNDDQFIIDDDKGIITYKWTYEGIGDYYKWLNHLYNEGIITDQSFDLRYSEYIDKISKGNVLALSDIPEDYADAVASLENKGKYDRTYAPLGVTMDGSGDQFLREDGSDIGCGIAITSSCADPIRVFRFLDWYCSDEAQELANTAEGHTYPFPMRFITDKDSDGNYYSSQLRANVSAGYNEAQKETLEGYGAELFTDMFTSRDIIPISRHGSAADYGLAEDSEIGIITSACDTYIRTELTSALKLPEDKFETKWDEIEQWLTASGGDWLNGLISDMTKEKEQLYFGE